MLFSRLETLLIALALLVPEGLRSYAKPLEPYPAVILPAGAGTIRITRGKVPTSRTFLTARRNGEWQEVDVDKFMAPIAEHYFSRIARRDFGLPGTRRASPAKQKRVAATKRWMKAKLAAQGFEAQQMRLMSERMTIALSSGKRASSKSRLVKTYDLD